MNAARRPLAVAIVLCFYASLLVVAVDRAFDQDQRGAVVAGGLSISPAANGGPAGGSNRGRSVADDRRSGDDRRGRDGYDRGGAVRITGASR